MRVTVAQAMKSVEVCQSVSNLLRDIHLYRFDPLTGNIYILTGDNMGLIINQFGKLEFEKNDDAEL
jgi:hypothetical protein